MKTITVELSEEEYSELRLKARETDADVGTVLKEAAKDVALKAKDERKAARDADKTPSKPSAPKKAAKASNPGPRGKERIVTISGESAPEELATEPELIDHDAARMDDEGGAPAHDSD